MVQQKGNQIDAFFLVQIKGKNPNKPETMFEGEPKSKTISNLNV